MTGEHVEVTASALIGHAAAVDRVADAVDQRRAAGAHVQLGREAYGQLCQMVPMLLDPIQQIGVDALAGAVDALRESADTLRTAAREYDRADGAAAQRFGVAP